MGGRMTGMVRMAVEGRTNAAGNAPRVAAKRTGEAGFTLLEAVIVSVIFSALIVSIYETVTVGQNASTELTGRSQFEGAARETMQRLQREFYRARVVAVDAPPLPPALTYQLPVDADGDGDTTDASEEIEWGSPEPGDDLLGGQVRVEWRFDRLVSETDDDADYNADGDRTDSFQIGRLTRVSAGGQELPIGPNTMAMSVPLPGGDMTGDGTPDPLFTWDGSILAVDMFFLNDDPKRGGPEIFRQSTRVTPRNPVP
jgi:type II secretory pathway pseudopilin PulG